MPDKKMLVLAGGGLLATAALLNLIGLMLCSIDGMTPFIYYRTTEAEKPDDNYGTKYFSFFGAQYYGKTNGKEDKADANSHHDSYKYWKYNEVVKGKDGTYRIPMIARCDKVLKSSTKEELEDKKCDNLTGDSKTKCEDDMSTCKTCKTNHTVAFVLILLGFLVTAGCGGAVLGAYDSVVADKKMIFVGINGAWVFATLIFTLVHHFTCTEAMLSNQQKDWDKGTADDKKREKAGSYSWGGFLFIFAWCLQACATGAMAIIPDGAAAPAAKPAETEMAKKDEGEADKGDNQV